MVVQADNEAGRHMHMARQQRTEKQPTRGATVTVADLAITAGLVFARVALSAGWNVLA